jgi:hypothetical protein
MRNWSAWVSIKSYDDDQGTNSYSIAANAGTSATIMVPASGKARVQVVGRRSFGGDRATGTAEIGPQSGNVDSGSQRPDKKERRVIHVFVRCEVARAGRPHD